MNAGEAESEHGDKVPMTEKDLGSELGRRMGGEE